MHIKNDEDPSFPSLISFSAESALRSFERLGFTFVFSPLTHPRTKHTIEGGRVKSLEELFERQMRIASFLKEDLTKSSAPHFLKPTRIITRNGVVLPLPEDVLEIIQQFPLSRFLSEGLTEEKARVFFTQKYAEEAFEIYVNSLDEEGFTSFLKEKDENGRGFLWYAIRYGRLGCVRSLFRLMQERRGGAEILACRDHQGNSLMCAAALSGDLSTLQFLIRYKVSVCGTSLLLAAQEGHHKIVSFLLQKGAPPDFVGDRGITPLHHATQQGNLKMVREIVDALCQQRNSVRLSLSETPSASTALHLAAAEGHIHIVRFLVEQGAAGEAIAPLEGDKAVHRAIEAGQEVVVRYFIQEREMDVHDVLIQLRTLRTEAPLQGNFPRTFTHSMRSLFQELGATEEEINAAETFSDPHNEEEEEIVIEIEADNEFQGG